jgi:hypothetical protein
LNRKPSACRHEQDHVTAGAILPDLADDHVLDLGIDDPTAE